MGCRLAQGSTVVAKDLSASRIHKLLRLHLLRSHLLLVSRILQSILPLRRELLLGFIESFGGANWTLSPRGVGHVDTRTEGALLHHLVRLLLLVLQSILLEPLLLSLQSVLHSLRCLLVDLS